MIALIIAEKNYDTGLRARMKAFRCRPRVEHRQEQIEHLLIEYDLITISVPIFFRERRKEKLTEKLRKILEKSGQNTAVFAGEEAYYFRAKLRSSGLGQISDFLLKKIFWQDIFELLCDRVSHFEKAVVVDYEGMQHSEEILRSLCRRFHNVAVITANESRFDDLREEIMEETGAAVQCYTHLDDGEGAALALLCSGGDRQLFRLARLKNAQVFHFSSDLPNFYYGMNHVTGKIQVEPNEQIKSIFPPCFAPETIAAALAEQLGEEIKQLYTLKKIE